MGLGLGGFVVAVGEASEDRLLADDGRAVLEHEDRDRLAAGRLDQLAALRSLDRYLVDDVVEPELGQPLAHVPRGRTPLGLVELEHQRVPPTTSRNESKRRCRLPQTASQSAKTAWSAIE